MAALHAEAVPPEVVVPARWAHQPTRRIRLQPPLILSPVPDAVFGPEHPSPPLAVEHAEVPDRDAKRPRLKVSDSTFLDEELVADFCLRERIDGHAQSMPGANR